MNQCVEDILAAKGHIALNSYPHRIVCVCLHRCHLLPKQALKSTWVQHGKCMYRFSTGWMPNFPCASMQKKILFVFITLRRFAPYILLQKQLKNVLCITMLQYADM